jgi:hypothetical protein
MIFQRQKLIQIHRHQSKCIYIQKIPAQRNRRCAVSFQAMIHVTFSGLFKSLV